MTASVYVVDDDEAVRDSLGELLGGLGYRVLPFASGEAFLAAHAPDWRGCVLLDLAMPGMSGAEVQAELLRRGSALPVIFLSGHGDIPSAVKAVKAGALDFLQKPVSGRLLHARIDVALHRDAELSGAVDQAAVARAKFEQLTPRERSVLGLAAAGHSNKEIGRMLGISYRTVEIHRARMMRKVGASSVVELVAIAAACELPHAGGAGGA